MRALVKQEAGPGLVMTEVPEPEIGINDVLIRVDRTGSAVPTSTSRNGTSGRSRPSPSRS